MTGSLACSGFELYGQVIHAVPQNVYPVKPLGSAHEMSFDYESDFDENGLLYYLGTFGCTKSWVNPGIAGIVGVSASSLGSDAERITSFVGRETVRCCTKSEKNSDMTIDLKKVRMNVTKYTLRHYISWDTEALRYWNLEGSVDEVNWVILKSHIGDASLNKMGATKTWDVSHQGWFQYFRIITTGPNSNNHDYLCCSGIELYGNAVGGFVSHRPIGKVEDEELFGSANEKIFSKKALSPEPSKKVSNVPIGTICYCRQPLSKIHDETSAFSEYPCRSCCAFLLGNVFFYCENEDCIYQRIGKDLFMVCASCYNKDVSIYLRDMKTETCELIAAKIRMFLHATSSVSFFSF